MISEASHQRLKITVTRGITRLGYFSNVTAFSSTCLIGSLRCLVVRERALHVPSQLWRLVLRDSHYHRWHHAGWLGHQGEQVPEPCEDVDLENDLVACLTPYRIRRGTASVTTSSP